MYAILVSAAAAVLFLLSPLVATAAPHNGNGSKASSLALDGVRGRALAIEVAPGLALGLRSQTPPNGVGVRGVGGNGNGVGGNGNGVGGNGNGVGGNGNGNDVSIGPVGGSPNGADANGPAPVPEPSSMIVFAAGLLIARGWAGRLARCDR